MNKKPKEILSDLTRFNFKVNNTPLRDLPLTPEMRDMTDVQAVTTHGAKLITAKLENLKKLFFVTNPTPVALNPETYDLEYNEALEIMNYYQEEHEMFCRFPIHNNLNRKPTLIQDGRFKRSLKSKRPALRTCDKHPLATIWDIGTSKEAIGRVILLPIEVYRKNIDITLKEKVKKRRKYELEMILLVLNADSYLVDPPDDDGDGDINTDFKSFSRITKTICPLTQEYIHSAMNIWVELHQYRLKQSKWDKRGDIKW